MKDSSSRDSSTIRAICYIYKEGDDKNKCLLTDSDLKVIYKAASFNFSLKDIQEIQFKNKRLMLPLIFGGLIATFSLIAIFKNLFNPWLSLSVFISGSLICYYGYMGTNVLIIKEQSLESDFMLKHVSINILAFVKYAKKILLLDRNLLDQHKTWIYHIANPDNWQKAEKEGFYSDQSLQTQGFIHASDYDQVIATSERYFERSQELLLLAIDPEKVRPEIKYERSPERNELFPHIYGPINLDAIRQLISLKRGSDGKFTFPSTF
ncbi:DUF952 domain-containing protein [Fulvivirgaceae bacterium BMA10]|uniref:DUF952 domain-containing protein n=1 Tax=Splendidivirga corallicola TaxID=3051826 RepID=A0ABT8KLQ2_9BACT|nr:DUF952 domain-containing protein [Fulvivirgaceae bacterium BMA10]